jgi:hypothetical protein
MSQYIPVDAAPCCPCLRSTEPGGPPLATFRRSLERWRSEGGVEPVDHFKPGRPWISNGLHICIYIYSILYIYIYDIYCIYIIYSVYNIYSTIYHSDICIYLISPCGYPNLLQIFETFLDEWWHIHGKMEKLFMDVGVGYTWGRQCMARFTI